MNDINFMIIYNLFINGCEGVYDNLVLVGGKGFVVIFSLSLSGWERVYGNL